MTTNRFPITGWSAKRAGAGMTITGKGASGEPVKLTNVAEIVAGDQGPVAFMSNGDRINLA